METFFGSGENCIEEVIIAPAEIRMIGKVPTKERKIILVFIAIIIRRLVCVDYIQ
jgi:hypothetical protein